MAGGFPFPALQGGRDSAAVTSDSAAANMCKSTDTSILKEAFCSFWLVMASKDTERRGSRATEGIREWEL